MAEINFYKNISIAGGFLLLFVTGAGKYSVDAKLDVKSGTEPSRQQRSA
jgi:putative oxidoreductase